MCKFDYYHCVRALFQEPTTSVRTWPCEPLPKHVHSNRHSQIDDRSLPHTSTTTASLTGSLKPGLCTHLWLSAWFCLYIAHLSTQARSVVSCCCLISFVRVNYLFSICLLLAILHLLCVWFRPTLTVLASIIYNHSACLNSVFVCISMQNCHLNTSLSFVYLNHIFHHHHHHYLPVIRQERLCDFCLSFLEGNCLFYLLRVVMFRISTFVPVTICSFL